MKLPRWLSAARTVQARTGWPQPVCRQFVSRLDRAKLGEDSINWALIAVAASLLALVPAAALFVVLRDSVPYSWRRWIIPGAGAAAIVMVNLAYFRRRRARLFRALDDFRGDPWCLKCRYPTPDAAPVCPECGEPIPPEIARLAAERRDK